MKRSFTLTLATLAVSLTAHGQSLNINGTSYAGYFGPANNVSVNPPAIPDGTVLGVVLGGTTSGTLNPYWTAAANGGAVLGSNAPDIGTIVTPELRVLASGAQVALTGSALEFNISNQLSSNLLGNLLNTGLALNLSWDAKSTFTQLVLQPNTTYQIGFDVNGSNGLLNSTLGIAPTFGVRLLDGATAVGTAGGGTLINVLGLSLGSVAGAPVGTGHATVQFTTGSTVSGLASGLEFTGSAAIPATVAGLGTNFATISNVSVIAVPETSSVAIAALGGLLAIRRRR